jgi:hypothetical protein
LQIKTLLPGRQTRFVFTITNTGNVRDSFTIRGDDDTMLGVKYFAGRTNVTAAVLAGTFVTTPRSPGRAVKINLEVQLSPDAVSGDTYQIALYATSVGDPSTGWDRAFGRVNV